VVKKRQPTKNPIGFGFWFLPVFVFPPRLPNLEENSLHSPRMNQGITRYRLIRNFKECLEGTPINTLRHRGGTASGVRSGVKGFLKRQLKRYRGIL